jgi:hypothetical protein
MYRSTNNLPTMKSIITTTFVLTVSILQTISLQAQNCTVNSGLPQTICPDATLNLSGVVTGNLSASPTIMWTIASGAGGTIANPSNTATAVSGYGSNYAANTILVYRLSATCLDGVRTYQDVTVTVKRKVSQATVGANVSLCAAGTYGPLQGSSLLANETGVWTSTPSAGVTFSNASSPTSNYTITQPGVFTFKWTVSASGTGQGCSTNATMTVTQSGPAAIDAGADVTLNCAGNSTTLNGSNPGLSPQVGNWTVVSGPNTPSFSNVNASNSTISNVVVGTYVLQWNVSGPCSSGSDQMNLVVANVNSTQTAVAGTNLSFCVGSNVTQALLTGTIPKPGVTAVWTATTSPATGTTIVSPNAASTLITGLSSSAPAVYTYNYKLTTDGGCISTTTRKITFTSDVTVNEPTAKNKVLACGVTTTTCQITRITPSTLSGGNVTTSSSTISGTGSASVTSSVGLTDTWTVTGLTPNAKNIIRFNYSSPCGNAYVDMTFQTSSSPSVASNAGTDQILPCELLQTNLAGNAVSSPNQGTWYLMSGPNVPTITNKNLNSSSITGLVYGDYFFRWEISNGLVCPGNRDTVKISCPSPLGSVNAGADVTICYATPYKMNSTGLLPGQSVSWTVSPSSGVTFSPSNVVENPVVDGLVANTTYTFTKRITIPCGTAADNVIIKTNNVQGPPKSLAGSDVCTVSTTTLSLSANAPSPYAGTWSSVGTILGTISSASSANTTVTGMTSGTYYFVWTINGGSCGTTRDTVMQTISQPASTSVAGADQYLCNVTSTTLLANSPTIGTGRWSQSGGPLGAVITNPNSNSTTVTNLIQGNTYFFTWMISNGACSSNSSSMVVTISSPPASNANAGADQTICSTSATLSANAVSAGETGYWNIVSIPLGASVPTFSSVSNPASSISGLSTGTYLLEWVILKDGSCPASTDEVSISVQAPATISSSVTSSYCDVSSIVLQGTTGTNGVWSVTSQPVGSPLVNLTAMNQGLSYQSVASPLIIGTYTFRYDISSFGSCASSNASKTTTIVPIQSIAIAGNDINVCLGSASTNLNATAVTTGVGAWTQTSGPNTSTIANSNSPTSSISNLVPGVYLFTWTVTNASCPASTDIVQVNVEGAASAGTNQNVCSATMVTLSGNTPVVGAGTWSYISGPTVAAISSPNSPVTNATNLIDGTYQFKWTTTLSGCSANESTTTIVNNTSPNAPVVQSTTQPTCATAAASASLSGLPSSGNWTIATFPGVATVSGTGTTAVFTNLSPNNNYQFKVTDLHGCTSALSTAVSINGQPSTPGIPTVSVTNPTCNVSTGSVNVGSLPSIGNWTVTTYPGATTTNGSGTTKLFSGLPAITSYSYTVVNAEGCTSLPTTTAVINAQPTSPSLSIAAKTNVNCYGQPTGSISIGVSGGVLPYTYSWTPNVSSSATAINIAAGTYTAIVTGQNGCSKNIVTSITQPAAPISISYSVTNASCGTYSNGAISLTTTGGTAPYTYSWSNGATSADIANLLKGNYTVTVKDHLDCSYLTTINVGSDNCYPVAQNDALVVNEDVSTNGNVSANDAPSGDGGNVWSIVSGPLHGSIVFNANGSFSYTPAFSFIGKDYFTYKICDVNNDCSTATDTLTVHASTLLFKQQINTGIESNVTSSWTVSTIDYNSDGYDDLFFTEVSGSKPNRLFVNNGNGTFTQITTGRIVTDITKSISSSWADVDNDGDLDVVIANNTLKPSSFFINNGDGTFTKNTTAGFTQTIGYYHHVSFVDVDNDGIVELYLGNYWPTRLNELWKQNQNGEWSLWSSSLLSQVTGSATGSTWSDYDNDGFQDLIILNNDGSNNRMYHNLGNGQFEQVFNEVTQQGGNSVASTWGDIDNDGDLDLFISNASNRNNELYTNNGGGQFTLQTSGEIVSDGGNSHGASFADVDRDGDLDLYVANNTSNKFLYINNGAGLFTKKTDEFPAANFGNSMGVAFSDIDLDGDMDLIASTISNEKNFIFTANNSANKWLNVRLVGTISNRSGIGARIRVKANGRWQMREVNSQSGMGGQSSYRQNFGLSNATSIDSIQVIWPSGFIQTIRNTNPNQNMVLTEPNFSHVTARVYYDQNNNCVFDQNEMTLPNIKFAVNNGSYISYSNSKGVVSMNVGTGSYSVSLSDNTNYSSVCSQASSFTIATIGDTVNLGDYALQPVCNYADLEVGASTTIMRKGFPSKYVIHAKNINSVLANNVTLSATLPTSLQIDSSSVAWSTLNVVNDKSIITWQFDSLQVGRSKVINVYYRVPTTVDLNSTLESSFRMAFNANDCDTANNYITDFQTIYGSIDPNDLLAFPTGVTNHHFISHTQPITYKIRFQNVGNYPAEFVNIACVLPVGLNLSTIYNISASHHYEMSIEGNSLRVHFPKINLCDSTTNVEASNGYFMFTVPQNKNNADGLVLYNQATIQFDYNEYIYTNKVFHKVKHDLSSQGNQTVFVYPNPTSSELTILGSIDETNPSKLRKVIIQNNMGAIVAVEEINTNNHHMYINHLPSGVYNVTVVDENNNRYYTKAIKIN